MVLFARLLLQFQPNTSPPTVHSKIYKYNQISIQLFEKLTIRVVVSAIEVIENWPKGV